MIFTQAQLDAIIKPLKDTIVIMQQEVKRLEDEVLNERKRAEIAIDRLLMQKDVSPVSPSVVEAANKQHAELKRLFSGLEQVGDEMSAEEDAARHREPKKEAANV